MHYRRVKRQIRQQIKEAEEAAKLASREEAIAHKLAMEAEREH